MGKVVSIQPYIEKRIELERVLLVAETFVLYRRAHRCAPRSLDELAEWLTSIAPHHLPIDPYAILSPAQIAMLKSDVKRNRFGPMRGAWGDSEWRGGWGEVPPYRCPVFVLTHHAHDPIEMEGGTTFHFATDGIESAYAQAKAAAGDRAISIAGGASCARQAIEAGLVDEIDLQVNPVILGSGERLLDGFEAGKPTLELVRVLEAPGVAHLRYRVIR